MVTNQQTDKICFRLILPNLRKKLLISFEVKLVSITSLSQSENMYISRWTLKLQGKNSDSLSIIWWENFYLPIFAILNRLNKFDRQLQFTQANLTHTNNISRNEQYHQSHSHTIQVSLKPSSILIVLSAIIPKAWFAEQIKVPIVHIYCLSQEVIWKSGQWHWCPVKYEIFLPVCYVRKTLACVRNIARKIAGNRFIILYFHPSKMKLHNKTFFYDSVPRFRSTRLRNVRSGLRWVN